MFRKPQPWDNNGRYFTLSVNKIQLSPHLNIVLKCKLYTAHPKYRG